jgi:hypothetical protein
MCALRRELVVDFSDLRHLRIACGSERCQSVVIIDLEAKDSVALKVCPGCNDAFKEDFLKALDTFKESYRGIVGRADMPKVGFTIPFDAKVTQT